MCAGLSALGTGDEEVFEDLKGVLYTDDAVAGEAAGLSMGLLLAGTGASEKVGAMWTSLLPDDCLCDCVVLLALMGHDANVACTPQHQPHAFPAAFACLHCIVSSLFTSLCVLSTRYFSPWP